MNKTLQLLPNDPFSFIYEELVKEADDSVFLKSVNIETKHTSVRQKETFLSLVLERKGVSSFPFRFNLDVSSKEEEEEMRNMLKNRLNYVGNKKINNYFSFDKLLFNSFSSVEQNSTSAKLFWTLSTGVFEAFSKFTGVSLREMFPLRQNETKMAVTLFKGTESACFGTIFLVLPSDFTIETVSALSNTIRDCFLSSKVFV